MIARVVIGAAFAVIAGAARADEAREAAALKAVCAKCHNLELVTDTPRSLPEWQDTIQQMVDRGAKGTDAQFDDLLDFLHRTETTVNVNSAEADELQLILGVSPEVAAKIIARRPLANLEDLKSVPGVAAGAVDARAKLIFFK